MDALLSFYPSIFLSIDGLSILLCTIIAPPPESGFVPRATGCWFGEKIIKIVRPLPPSHAAPCHRDVTLRQRTAGGRHRDAEACYPPPPGGGGRT